MKHYSQLLFLLVGYIFGFGFARKYFNTFECIFFNVKQAIVVIYDMISKENAKEWNSWELIEEEKKMCKFSMLISCKSYQSL